MLGEYLKNYRMKRNLSQKAMAAKIGTSQGYYSQIESGARKPGLMMVDRIAAALEIKPSSVRKML